MSNKRNIDRLFQEKFKDFEASPSKDLWKDIEAQLDNKKKDRKVIPFWWKLGGIAAGLALLITIGYTARQTDSSANPVEVTDTENKAPDSFVNGSENTEGAIVNTNNDSLIDNVNPADKTEARTPVHDSNTTNSSISKPYKKKQEEAYAIRQDKENHITNNTKEGIAATQTQSNDVLQNKKTGRNINKEDSKTLKNPLNKPEEQKEVVAVNDTNDGKMSIFDAIEKEKEVVANQGRKNKWSLNPTIAPVYYNSFSGNSPIHSQFDGNNKSGNINMSYGLNIAYQINDKLSIRSGLNKVDMGYNTNNVEFSPASFNAEVITNIAFANESTRLNVSNDLNKGMISTALETPLKTNAVYDGSMNQQFGYIEVPLELKYRVLDKKLGVNLIGGVSSLFLTDNNISLEGTDGLRTKMGEAVNLNSTNFSTNFGIGFDYKFSNRFLINMEPMFKYQLNTFSSGNNGFKPYTLGVYTGFSFRF